MSEVELNSINDIELSWDLYVNITNEVSKKYGKIIVCPNKCSPVFSGTLLKCCYCGKQKILEETLTEDKLNELLKTIR